MKRYKNAALYLSGLCAGAVNGLFGAGGGMLLVPLLGISSLSEDEVFPSCVAIILPICLVSLLFALQGSPFSWNNALPYLLGSFFGGLIATALAHKIPTLWLHRLLGVFILWGGVRYLC